MHLAVIPARSGSKGLKDKNIKMLAGKPMLAYTIETAIESNLFDKIHVSTDSELYADIARQYGAEVPFLRSKENSSDGAGSWDVVKEVLNKYSDMKAEFEYVTLLQPTSPLRTAEDIRNAYMLFQEKNANAVVSVCKVDHPPFWSNVLPTDLSMESFFINKQITRRQEIQTYYRVNGAIYMIDRDFLYKDTNIYRAGCYAYIMDRKRSIDIDEEIDFEFAEFLIASVSNVK